MDKNKKIWSSKRVPIMSLYFDFSSIREFDVFQKRFLDLVDFGFNYSVLLRVEFSVDNSSINHNKNSAEGNFRMAGTQIPFALDSKESLNVLNNLYNKIMVRLDKFCLNYGLVFFDSIQILIVKIDLLPELLTQNINKIKFPSKNVNVKVIKSKFNSKLLPLTMDFRYYGKLLNSNTDQYNQFINIINNNNKLLSKDLIDCNSYQYMFLYNNEYILCINKYDNRSVISVYDSKMGVFEGKFIDTVIDNNIFCRRYKDTIFFLKKGVIFKLEIYNKVNAISKKGVNKYILESNREEEYIISNKKIGVFDIETFKLTENTAKVYAAGFFALGDRFPKMYYLNNKDYDTSRGDVLLRSINDMLCDKYNGFRFYVHNLSFDGIFVLHKLKYINLVKGFEFYKIDTLFREDELLKITISVLKDECNTKKIKITLVDSLSLLNNNLRDLCKAFELEDEGKGFFPYSFVNKNTLNYIGVTPPYHYWENREFSFENYKQYLSSNWSTKRECLKYLQKDLTSLLKIIDLFGKYIIRKFDVQITNCLTISRLSFNIYLKHYLKRSEIPVLKGSAYEDIKLAYYGGITEVYIPHGVNLYYYDVNSLYPFAALNPICGCDYKYLESLDRTGFNLEDLFGFFYCEVETTDNYLGLLPYRTKDGLIMPNGKWSGWYFSEELKFAKLNGYKIKVIKGYKFNKELNVFTDYVNFLYKIKSTTTNKVERSIIKSLLNNFLGRFGMSIYKPVTELVDNAKYNFLLSTRKVNSFKKLNEDCYLVNYNPTVSQEICNQYGYDYLEVLKSKKFNIKKALEFNDVSVSTSAAITSYARIYMSKIKLDILNKGGRIYYTDTDSIVTDIKLDHELVGNALGQFKLEHVIKEGFFISSKTLGLYLNNNKHVIKSKGFLSESIGIDVFKGLYFNKLNVTGIKRSALKNYSHGSVVIHEDEINLFHDAYKKREKIYCKNLWINTKPLYIDTFNSNIKENKFEYYSSRKAIVKYVKPLRNLIPIKKHEIFGKPRDGYNTTKESDISNKNNFYLLINKIVYFIEELYLNKQIIINYSAFILYSVILFIIFSLYSNFCINNIILYILKQIVKRTIFHHVIYKQTYKFKSNKVKFNKKIFYTNKENFLYTMLYFDRTSLLKKIIYRTFQEIFNFKILNDNKKYNINFLIKYTNKFILKVVEEDKLKIFPSEYFYIVESMKTTIFGNEALKSILINEEKKNKINYLFIYKDSPERYCNTFKNNEIFTYNKVSKEWLNKYESWVIDSYSNEYPGDIKLFNVISLFHELL